MKIRHPLSPDDDPIIEAALFDLTSDQPSPRAQACIDRLVMLMVAEEGTCAAAIAHRRRNSAKLPTGRLDLAAYAAEIYEGGMNQ